MLKNSSIILIVIIGLLILYLIFDNSLNISNPTKKTIIPETFTQKNYYYSKKIDSVNDDTLSWSSDSCNSCNSLNSNNSYIPNNKVNLNPNFIDIKWHTDYRDVIDGINNIVANRKQRFNIANIPLIYSEPDFSEVKVLVNDFIYVLNDNIMTQVPTNRNPNSGWDENVPEPNMESGWEKSQRALGLPVSLYEKPAPKSIIRLISIKSVQKYETDDEIKYSVLMIIQKDNVDDQMVIEVSFVQDKRMLRDEDNFFLNNPVYLKVIIEDVYTKGFLSNDGQGSNLLAASPSENFYDFNRMDTDVTLDPKEIQKILMQNYRLKAEETEHRNAMLDDEGRDFHRDLPNLYDYPNIQASRTIFDDFNEPKVFY